MISKRPVLRYHGGKYRMAARIIAHFPAHRIYVEPFAGAASVLLRKARSYAEVINDLDDEVVNLFRVLRDPHDAAEMERQVRLTPYARIEFEQAYMLADDPIERARRLLIRSYMGYGSGGCNIDRPTGFRASTTRAFTTPAHDWAGYQDYIRAFTVRLQGVVIEHRDAIDVIRQHDHPDALIYCDPPYVHDTRSPRTTGVTGKHAYRHEMTDEDHTALATVLRTAASAVILSGYRGALYDDLYAGWEMLEFTTLADGTRARTECLWFNPSAWERRPNRSMFGD